MALHVHGTIVTQYGIAANNRGENEGNITTLQKIIWKQLTHTTVSAEAIRYALRLQWQHRFEDTGDSLCETNRVWDPLSGAAGSYLIKDQAYSSPEQYIDDDVMGFMDAKAAKAEANPEEQKEASGKKNKERLKGTTTARRGPLEVSRAVSLLPFNGETTFNAKGGEKGRTSLYGTEVHATSYQYSFSLTPSELYVSERAKIILESFASLGDVGGNQARFLYDFSPSLVIYRLTHDPAPRILYAAEILEEFGGGLSVQTLIGRVESGDIAGEELIVGGELLDHGDGHRLRALGAQVHDGVRAATAQATARLEA